MFPLNSLRSSRPHVLGVAAIAAVLGAPVHASASVATLDDWCGVIQELDVLLDEDPRTLGLAEVQAVHADVLDLLEETRGGLELIDADRRDDLTAMIDFQESLSRLVVDAADEAAVAAVIDEATGQEPSVDESTYEWLTETCTPLAADGPGTEPAPAAAPASHGDRSVIVDYSPTVSDVGALAFLAARSDVDLLAVTMPGTGESDCAPGAATTRAVLDAAGRSDVPVGCGSDTPLAGEHDWPAEWREGSNALAEVVAPGVEGEFLDAEAVLAEALRAANEPVTILAVAPLTNVASVLRDDPSLADRIERIVVMGGAVSVGGNVEDAPDAEWNLFVDPVAAHEVVESGIAVSLVPLDATNEVPLTAEFVSAVGELDGDVAGVLSAVYDSQDSFDYLSMWDEAAAVVALQPEAATWSDMSISIGDDGSTNVSDEGAAVQVAVALDPASVHSIVVDALADAAG